jgi:hypothetical protein
MIAFGVHTDICFCLGNGKNEAFLRKLNEEQKFFKKIIGLEHHRFVMQYKSKTKQVYMDKYLAALMLISMLSGCATIVNGSKQEVAFSAPPLCQYVLL